LKPLAVEMSRKSEEIPFRTGFTGQKRPSFFAQLIARPFESSCDGVSSRVSHFQRFEVFEKLGFGWVNGSHQ